MRGSFKTVYGGARAAGYAEEAVYADKILCVADQEAARSHETILSACECKMITVAGPVAAEQALARDPGILVGLAFLDKRNHEAMDRLVSRHRELKWIALVEGRDTSLEPVQHTIANFFDYHTLPIDIDRLKIILGHARGVADLQRRADSKRHEGDGKSGIVHDMIGTSEVMRALHTKIEKVAPTNFPVLITGESGTGKELVARAIHRISQRSEEPFVAVNCGAIVPTLIQSELFGHEKGSFTSANRRRAGHFETADGGTVFLDEIAELPLEAQANLLRVLEEKMVRRVGSSFDLPTDVRVIAATNRNLTQALAEGNFREDLLYRLNVVNIQVPPLRKRQDDIERLSYHYLNKMIAETGAKTGGFAKNAIDAMHLHTWPGNVRELINRINNAALLRESRLIHAQDLGLDFPTESIDLNQGMTLKEIREKAEYEAIKKTLEKKNFNVSLAARALGISRVTLYTLARKYGLRE